MGSLLQTLNLIAPAGAAPPRRGAKPKFSLADEQGEAKRLGIELDEPDGGGDGGGTVAVGKADAARAGARRRKDKERPQTTVTIHNVTGSALRLLDAKLHFATARFVPAAPPLIAPLGKALFRVVETTIGADGGGATLRYHIERRRQDVNVVFAWDRLNTSITFESDTKHPFSTALDAVRDTEAGNSYDLLVKDFAAPDPLELRIDILNRCDFTMTLVSATLEDPASTEFRVPPKRVLEHDIDTMIRAQGLDEGKPEAAGNVVYRIDRPKTSPHFARMTWRRGATPTGQMSPNDGMFEIVSGTGSDRIQHRVVRRDGPTPPPPKPMRVTIVNTAAFALEQDLLALDNDKARFLSRPAQTLEGGRKAVFEVDAPDPEFPNKSGIVAYVAKVKPADGGAETEVVINLDWRSQPPPSFSKIVPPTDGVSVEISGSPADPVFTVGGPAIDFQPPHEAKQPTLRLGDKSADGWVEYLQESLNQRIGAGLKVDGDFGNDTLKAVKKFQRGFKDQGVLEDGIVGDETWSFLRDGVKEKPKTDGRKPHTFVERGNEARWVRETAVCRFEPGEDALVMEAVSVGDADQLKDRRVRIRITDPSGVRKVLERSIGPGRPSSTTGQGSAHSVKVEDFATLFDDRAARGKPPPGSYTVEAFFDADLGGDQFSQVVTISER